MRLQLPAVRIVTIYAVFSVLWIAFSDRLVSVLARDPDELTRLQTFKGWGFVLLTATLLLILLQRQFAAMADGDRVLRDSEARFRALFEGANDAIFIHEAADGRIVDVNSRMCAMYGYSRDEALRLDVAAISENVAPYDAAAAADWIARAVAGAAPTFEWHARRRDGSLFWVEVSMRSYAESGGRQRVSALVRDISERREAADALRESEQRFATIAQTSPALLWMSDRGGERNWFNEPWLAFTGRRLEDEAGSGWIQSLHPDDREAALASFFEAAREERHFRSEYRLRRHDGVYRWLIDEGQPRYGADGTLLGFVGSCLDVTDARRASDALAASERRFRSLTEFLPNLAVYGCDAERRIIFWNAECVRLYGYSATEVLGSRVEDRIVPVDRRSEIVAAIDAWFAGGPAIPPGRERMAGKGGRTVDVYSSRVMQVNDAGGKEYFSVDIALPFPPESKR